MGARRIAAVCIGLSLAACVNLSDPTGSKKLVQDITATCRREEAAALSAAHPDAATVAQHDRLLRQAADIQSAAVARRLEGPAFDQAMGNAAQAQIEADALYDVRGKIELANECWAELGIARDVDAEMRARAAAEADEIDGERPASTAPDPIDYTLHDQPAGASVPEGIAPAANPGPLMSEPTLQKTRACSASPVPDIPSGAVPVGLPCAGGD